MAHANPTKPLLVHFTPKEAAQIEQMQTKASALTHRSISRTKIVQAALIAAQSLSEEQLVALIDGLGKLEVNV